MQLFLFLFSVSLFTHEYCLGPSSDVLGDSLAHCLGEVYLCWGSRDASLVYFGIIKSQILVASSVYFK